MTPEPTLQQRDASSVSAGERACVRVLHLYDEYLNIYADRGNISVLQQRCEWRGIDFELTGLALGDSFEPGSYDLLYVGGGQDRDQAMIAERIVNDCGQSIRDAVTEGTALLAVCGGYQLLGHSYLDTTGATQPGVGLFDMHTAAGETRMIGNEAIQCNLPAIGERAAISAVVSGFENHAGRTTLGSSARPLGRVIHGYGNDGISATEGCRLHHALGTYLHGPLLPRNPQIADWLLAAALAHAHGPDAATRIDDGTIPSMVVELELMALEQSVARAAAERR